jgi:hypothetical protein
LIRVQRPGGEVRTPADRTPRQVPSWRGGRLSGTRTGAVMESMPVVRTPGQVPAWPQRGGSGRIGGGHAHPPAVLKPNRCWDGHASAIRGSGQPTYGHEARCPGARSLNFSAIGSRIRGGVPGRRRARVLGWASIRSTQPATVGSLDMASKGCVRVPGASTRGDTLGCHERVASPRGDVVVHLHHGQVEHLLPEVGDSGLQGGAGGDGSRRSQRVEGAGADRALRSTLPWGGKGNNAMRRKAVA